jgi:hypothetical protein
VADPTYNVTLSGQMPGLLGTMHTVTLTGRAIPIVAISGEEAARAFPALSAGNLCSYWQTLRPEVESVLAALGPFTSVEFVGKATLVITSLAGILDALCPVTATPTPTPTPIPGPTPGPTPTPTPPLGPVPRTRV